MDCIYSTPPDYIRVYIYIHYICHSYWSRIYVTVQNSSSYIWIGALYGDVAGEPEIKQTGLWLEVSRGLNKSSSFHGIILVPFKLLKLLFFRQILLDAYEHSPYYLIPSRTKYHPLCAPEMKTSDTEPGFPRGINR